MDKDNKQVKESQKMGQLFHNKRYYVGRLTTKQYYLSSKNLERFNQTSPIEIWKEINCRYKKEKTESGDLREKSNIRNRVWDGEKENFNANGGMKRNVRKVISLINSRHQDADNGLI